MTPLTTVRTLKARMAEFAAGTLRGFALDQTKTYSKQDFIDLAATGANVVRQPIHLLRDPTRPINATTHHDRKVSPRYLSPDLSATTKILETCASLGIRVIVVLCPLPDGNNSEWWFDPDLQQDLTAKWVSIAGALQGYPALQAYDIINEPTGAPVLWDLAKWGPFVNEKTWWLSIAQVICSAIRTVDNKTPLMVEPTGWGQVGHFWLTNPVKVTGLVYSFHWYENGWYTCQGLGGSPMPVPLPESDFAEMLHEGRQFAKRTGIPIFVGEFNALRWAPDNHIWLERAIKMFAAEKWGWTVHVYRGWEGWDIEIPNSVPPFSGTAADRQVDTPAMLAVKRGIAST